MYDDEEYFTKFYRDVRDIYARCRGAGQTTVLEYIASVTPDAVIVVRDQQHKQQLERTSTSDGPDLVAVNDLPKYLLGRGRKILFWDNHAVLRIVERSADWVKGLTNQTYWLRTKLQDAESEISRLNAAHREALRYAGAKASAYSLLERDISEVEREVLDLRPLALSLQGGGARDAAFARSVARCAPAEFTARVQRQSADLYEEARKVYDMLADCERWIKRAREALEGRR